MTELLRQWLLGVTGAAMILALAQAMTPPGGVKQVGRFIGGLILLVAMVEPLLSLEQHAMAIAATAWIPAASQVMAVDLEQTNEEWMKTIIAEETGAYILDKAEALGMTCTHVTVTCEGGERPYPSAVTIAGTWTAEQQTMLSRILEADLAIPPENQTYEGGSGT